MTAEVDVKGGDEVSVPPKDLPHGNANADGGLVFVNGNVHRDDNVSSDPVKTDLNSGSSAVVEVDNDKAVVASQVSVSDEVEENGAEEKQVSSVVVSDITEGEVDRENGVLVDSSNAVGENPNSGVGSELLVVESAGDDQPQHSDLVDGATPPLEIAERVINDSADLPVELDLTREIPKANSTEELDLEASGSFPEGDVEAAADGGPGLNAGHIQYDAVQEETSELGDTSETAAETLPSPVVISENAPVIITAVNTESLPSHVVIENGSIENGQSVPAPSVTNPVEDAGSEASTDADVKGEYEIEKPEIRSLVSGSDSHPVDNVKVDNEVENGPAPDTVSSGGLNNNAGSEIGTGIGTTGFDMTLPEDSSIEPNVPEGVAHVENGLVDDDTVSTGLNNEAGSETDSELVEKVSTADNYLNMEPQVPEGVAENGLVGNDLISEAMSEEKLSTTKVHSSTEINVRGEETKVPEVPEEDSSTESKVPEEIINLPAEDSSTESKVPEEDSSTESKIPEEDSSTESNVPEEIKVPKEDSSMESKVREGVSSMETKVLDVIVGSVGCQCISVDNAASEKHTDDDPVAETEKHTDDDPVKKENAETESEMSSRDLPCEGEVASESEAQNVSVHSPVQVDNGEIEFTGEEIDDRTHDQVEDKQGIHRDEAPMFTSNSSVTSSEAQNVVTEAVAASEAQNVGTEVVKRPFYCLIKVPRFEDDNLKEQIKSFQLKVDEKTRSRDAVRDTIHLSRATFKESGQNLETLISEEKAAREALKSKRQEIDSLQSVINKVKNAISVEDIDGRIRQMRHMIEHETLPLKEEKQLIREIEQLKQHREQFSSSMGKQDEIQQAFDQKDQIEERLKVLRKEADSLRENVSKAEAATQAARKKHKDLSEKLRELQSQFKAADDTRQEAYKNFQSLRKQAYDKNKYFWKYKDDVKAANDLLSKGDKEALLNLCDNQVESVLEMWNNNDEFRKEYVKCNINSTIRRLKTLDGRSLGPNEEPPVIRPVVIDRVARAASASQVSNVKEEKPAQVGPVETEKENKPMANVGVEKVQAAKSQRPAKPAPLVNGSATVSGRKEIEEEREEEPKRTKEEEELNRRAEELRKKEEAAKLLEQRRLEEKVKAKEALERKKRIAEKAQARAALRAQKESEQKEKEREKRARKKEKKKVGAVQDTSVTNEEESVPSIETPTETPTLADVKDRSTTVTKKPQKPSHFTKQTKSKSVPLPLRNRGKRRMQSWMWVLIAALVVFALFLLGDSGFSFKSGLQWFGF